MTREEIIKLYGIPAEVLRAYVGWDLRRTPAGGRFDDRDLELLGILKSLFEIGFTPDEAEIYLRLLLRGKSTEAERCRLLRKKRESLLDELHVREKRLDRLDVLRFETENGK